MKSLWLRRIIPLGLGLGFVLAAGAVTFAATPTLVSPGPCATHVVPGDTYPGPGGGGGSGSGSGSGGC